MCRTTLFAAVILGTLALPTLAYADCYEIVFEDLIPGGPETGQPMTPPVGVVHDAGYSLFAPGDFASAGLEALARDGVTADLVAEAMASASVFAVEVGPGPFFDASIFIIQGTPGDLFSVVTMLARTNDLVTGIHDIVLPDNGGITIDPPVYDSGTEENTGLIEHIPFYGFPFVGPDEETPIAEITCYAVFNDPDHGVLEWCFPPGGRVTITYLGATPVPQTTWGKIKALYQ